LLNHEIKKKINLKEEHNKMTFLKEITNLEKITKISLMSPIFTFVFLFNHRQSRKAFLNFNCLKILTRNIIVCQKIPRKISA
jgi:hypothetical protein